METVRTSRLAAPAPPETLRGEIERFLASCRRPALMESGFEPLPLEQGRFALTSRGAALLMEAWDEARTFARRLIRIEAQQGGRLLLTAERFGRGAASVTLLDLDDTRTAPALRRNRHGGLATRLGQMLARQFPEWSVDHLTAGADLEHTLSPAYPRALLRRRRQFLAAICAPPKGADHALTFGLLWLAYLRRRLAPQTVRDLAIFLPRGEQVNTCLRVRHLDPLKAGFQLYVYDSGGEEHALQHEDAGNLLSRLEPWRAADSAGACEASLWARRIALEPGVEAVELGGGVRSLRVAGLEFARLAGRQLWVGIGRKRSGRDPADAFDLARRLAAIRLDPAAHPGHEWARSQPEARLESLVRAHLPELDPSLHPAPIYGQVCAIAGRDRGLVDLLAVDHNGRLAVIELKASEDPHLPLQALDYWIRVSHHAAAAEFGPAGFFPGHAILPGPPRLLLVAPALSFHPSTETLLEFFPSHLSVQRIGLGVEWQRSFRVVLRVNGASRPEWRPGRTGIR
jgi:hypothetical protein